MEKQQSACSSTPTIRHRLKADTHLLHEELERKMPADPLRSLEAYRDFLLIQSSVILPAEAFLISSRHFRRIPQAAERLRAQSLCADLQALGVDAAEPVQLCFCDTAATVAGIMYVLEGSRLGARILLSDEQAFPDLPTSFLQQGAGETFWKSYVNWLTASCWDEEQQQDIVLAARQLFQSFILATDR